MTTADKLSKTIHITSSDEVDQRQGKVKKGVSTVNLIERERNQKHPRRQCRLGLSQLRGSRKYKAMTQWMEDANN